MALPLQVPPPGFEDLKLDEKLEYIDRLYALIGAQPADGMHDWQKRILDDRLAAHAKDPGAARPWRESIDSVRAELHKRRS